MYQRTGLRAALENAVEAAFVPVEAAVSDNRDDSESVMGLAKNLISRIRLSDIEMDDLLLLAIVFFTLRGSGDDDLILIMAALFFTGFFDKK